MDIDAPVRALDQESMERGFLVVGPIEMEISREVIEHLEAEAVQCVGKGFRIGVRASFAPRLPPALRRIAFRMSWRGSRFAVEVDRTAATYRSRLGPVLDFADKVVLPVVTGGSPAHVLALDYALRPVLSSLGAHHIVQGWFVLDRHIEASEVGDVLLAPESAEPLYGVVDGFSAALHARRALAAAS